MAHKHKRPKVRLSRRQTIGVLFIILFAGLGIYFLKFSHAQSSYANAEAELGTLGTNATSVPDSNASNSKAVQFGTASGGGGTGSLWSPKPIEHWQWVLTGTFSTSSAKDMGTGVTAQNGDTSPGDDPTIFDFDGILNSAQTVADVHAIPGDHAICYIEVGTQGDSTYGYTAASEGTTQSYWDQLNAAGVLSSQVLAGYKDENFVNIASPAAVPILESEINQQCKAKGFDAVETDLDDTCSTCANPGPYAITEAQQITFLETLANYMHSLGLSWIAKDLDSDDENLVKPLEPYAQGMISEQTIQYSQTALWADFVNSDKWIGDAEYSGSIATICKDDSAYPDVNGVMFTAELDASVFKPCL